MASIAYNGWAGHIRDTRGEYSVKTRPRPNKDSVCQLCGQPNDGSTTLGYHGEEYGHTWQEYQQSILTLCARCHGMVHLRFKMPNRWERYKHICRYETYEGPKPKNMGEFFARTKGIRDIPEHHPRTLTGNPLIDGIPQYAYKGPPKIATKIYGDLEVPDPLVYPAGWDTMSGVIIRGGVTTAVSYKESQCLKITQSLK